MASKPEAMPMIAVLMAGGGGTRLWPLSRKDKPKQLLPLVGGRSLFALAVERLRTLMPPEDIYVSAGGALIEALQKSRTGVPKRNFICEPSPRNTAPAIAYALAVLRGRKQPFCLACLPADHYIDNTAEFQSLVRAAGELAAGGRIVTIGIEPTGPNTGYGYLEQGNALGEFGGRPALEVRRFKEKPTPEEARRMLATGGYYWNGGMFFWRSDILEEEFRRQQPEMAEGINRIAEALAKGKSLALIRKFWESMHVLSLDYAIMEHANSVAVVPTRSLGWTDIGSWDALVDLYQTRPELRPADPGWKFDAGSTSLSVIRDSSSKRILATVGLEDVIIVETEDAVLVCKKGKSQDVRAIAEAVAKSRAK